MTSITKKDTDNTMDTESNSKKYIRTDLAAENAPSEFSDNDSENIDKYGIKYRKSEKCGVVCEKISIESSLGEQIIGKPKGCYVTVSFGKIWLCSDSEKEQISKTVCRELREMAKSKNVLGNSVLICGLGNRFITADAIGPQSVDNVLITRHISDSIVSGELKHSKTSAICPGVVGQTGIETLEIIKGAVKSTKPDYIIAIDALAARSTDRLARTIQISDTGIAPGSGIGNCRAEICEEVLGVPVISIGVPTVVSSSTLVYDVFERAGVKNTEKKIERVLEEGQSFFVSVKESDAVVSELSAIISNAVNSALSKE